jgi:hypothetical protein
MIGTEAAGIRHRPILFAMIALAATSILATGLATSHSIVAGPEATPSPQATGYLPSISDLMIATIQPRHERLWQSEQDGNWEFAAYELGNLRGAFDRLGLAHPREHDVSFSDMIASATERPFEELKSAIQSKDAESICQGLCQSD